MNNKNNDIIPSFLNDEIENHKTPNEVISDYQDLAMMYAIYDDRKTLIDYAKKKYNIEYYEANNIFNSKSFLNYYENIKKDIKTNPNMPITMSARNALLKMIPHVLGMAQSSDSSLGDMVKASEFFAKISDAIPKNSEQNQNNVQIVLNMGNKKPSWAN